MDDHLLSTIRAKFLAMVPVEKFVWTESNDETLKNLLDPKSQVAILSATVTSDLCRKYPTSRRYQQAFVKSLLQKCESSCDEVADELYECYTSLLSRPPQSPTEDEFLYRTYLLDGERFQVTLRESTRMISQGTTGLNTWPAASFLTEWALENKPTFAGRKVLELGSGMGLAGLAVCRTCRPASFVFTDCHVGVLEGLRANVALNLPQTGIEQEDVPELAPGSASSCLDAVSRCPDVSVQCLDWEAVDEDDVQTWNAGVILASDVVYDTRIIEPLVFLLERLLRCQGDGQGRPVAFIASTIRNEDTYTAFTTAIDKHLISSEDLPGPKQRRLFYDRSCPIKLLSLKPDQMTSTADQ